MIPSPFSLWKTKKVSVLCDHKTGFMLASKLIKIFNELQCKDKKKNRIQLERKVFFHFWNQYKPRQKAVVIIRDPREVVISGYLYHKKCNETWAIRSNTNYYGPWIKHFRKSEVRRKKNLIEFGRFSKEESYQDKLNRLSEEDGIIYEMENPAYLTISGMYKYAHFGKEGVHTIKLEDLMFDSQETLSRLLDFLEIKDSTQRSSFLEKSQKHNILRMKHSHALDTHITNKEANPRRYTKFWTKRVSERFNTLFPNDLLSRLGYE